MKKTPLRILGATGRRAKRGWRPPRRPIRPARRLHRAAPNRLFRLRETAAPAETYRLVYVKRVFPGLAAAALAGPDDLSEPRGPSNRAFRLRETVTSSKSYRLVYVKRSFP